MCHSISNVKENFSEMGVKCPIAKCAKTVLQQANTQNRITIGLLPAIRYLSQNHGALFCFTTLTPSSDCATHMQEVLLQAFCAENDIYTVKVDSAQKIKKILHSKQPHSEFNCVLVHYPFADPFGDTKEMDLSTITQSERDLADYCLGIWNESESVIKLPEK